MTITSSPPPPQSSQVEWMLGTLLDMYECHPHEDMTSISLIVLGILKATAILKLVSALYTLLYAISHIVHVVYNLS